MVRIGVVGVGFMGMTHYYAIDKVRGAKVVAVCTRNPKKLNGDWRSIQGNFGTRGKIEDLSGVAKYNRVEDIIADPDIDLLDLCLPNHLHKEVAIAGLKAGKHVLVEKPIAVTLRDANQMVKASEKANRHLMVAHVLPFFPEFDFAKKTVESGDYGKMIGAHFKRIITRPTWSKDITDLSKTGGLGIDLHIHDTHFIQLLCGKPKGVYSRGILADGKYVQYVATQYLYDDQDLCVTCASGGISQPGRAFTHGYEIYLERATLLFESATLKGERVTSVPATLLTADGKVRKPRLGSGDPIDAFAAEIGYAVNAIRKGEDPAALSGEGARDALMLCHKEAQSVRTGKVARI